MLAVEGLTKRFGTFVAVDGVSFAIAPGEVVGVMGVNGAGKSTLLNCLSGVLRPEAGSIRFAGQEIARRAAYGISRLGMGRTFQIPRSFKSLTALQNLLVVPAPDLARRQDAPERAARALAAVRLSALSTHYAEELSGGQQKLLELARIMMIEPKLILMDEPFAGMHPDLCRIFIERVEELAAGGVSILLVSHAPDTLYRLSRKIIVMHQGRVIALGSPDEIQREPAVIDAYLGTEQW